MLRLILFCNSPVAFPAMEWLLQRNVIAGLVAPLQADAFLHVFEVAHRLRLPCFLMEAAGKEKLERWLAALQPDVAFVMTYPYRIPESTLNIPRFGFFNFHPGLLPAYRGPDPIFWEIRNREPEGGVTVHRMTARFDEGPVVWQQRIAIDGGDTYERHLQKLEMPFRAAAEWMLDRVLLSPDTLSGTPQNEQDAGYQRKPSLADCTVDWKEESAASIAALTRACHPFYDGALTWFRGMPIHLGPASVFDSPGEAMEPGTIHCASLTDGIMVRCRDGKSLKVQSLGPPGTPLMAPQFIQTFCLVPGERFHILQANG